MAVLTGGMAKDAALADSPSRATAYAWVVFALTFGLLLSDYMSRQVLNSVFPLLKADWGLSDAELGSLSGVVALTVGILTLPLSLAAARFGQVRSLIAMALCWSAATIGCALATGYGEMMIARLCVGVGEAAYGSVGIALILGIFPRHMRSTLTGAFMAGGAFGSVLGMAIGGVVAVHMGWRWSFGVMGLFGAALAFGFFLTVTERRLAKAGGKTAAATPDATARMDVRTAVTSLFSSVSVVCAYAGSGFQLFIMAAVIAWMPSYLNRYYALPADKAASLGALFVLIGALGMIGCGIATDRFSRTVPARKWLFAVAYALLSCILLTAAFALGPGTAQLVLIGAAMLTVAGTAGPAGAMVANLTPPAVHAAAFATLTLANNIFGLAPGPYLTGLLADRIGLDGALQWAPAVSIAAACCFLIGRRRYARDLGRLGTPA
ncbi:MFS transporter [Zavarzinia compransoris]|uniref:Multidrug DMT transporter permease n=1 Tax=Zavarzinia compransoris TaxID=1264899 RepID=A0A317DUG6_9PROT|nr:MFS transporter [Zavarzinia compransoris]PWR18319.1 multidrug DMT transporter permease [Zavarzinia compransoris]TDP43624.1 putative MFS family arabinose efflux permease [Zavarzinia compransoris]